MKLPKAEPSSIGAVMLLLSEYELSGGSRDLPPRIVSRFAMAGDGVDPAKVLSDLEEMGFIEWNGDRVEVTDDLMELADGFLGIVVDVGGRIYHREKARAKRSKVPAA
jgi:hypothetical protein